MSGQGEGSCSCLVREKGPVVVCQGEGSCECNCLVGCHHLTDEMATIHRSEHSCQKKADIDMVIESAAKVEAVLSANDLSQSASES